jgi:NAD(P)H-flavin reductase
VPPGWDAEKGFLTEDIIKKHVPDYAERAFYLSGPSVMVNAYKKLLLKIGVTRKNIITDYFPGFV